MGFNPAFKGLTKKLNNQQQKTTETQQKKWI
jgi:hypothetical protein